jgi:hypothetical protein
MTLIQGLLLLAVIIVVIIIVRNVMMRIKEDSIPSIVSDVRGFDDGRREKTANPTPDLDRKEYMKGYSKGKGYADSVQAKPANPSPELNKTEYMRGYEVGKRDRKV